VLAKFSGMDNRADTCFLDRKEGFSAANLLLGKGGYLYVSTEGRQRKGFYGLVSKLKP
jgi:hypothetical protein